MIDAAATLRRMAALPYADLDALAPGTALVLAPHPDDESLGCGGFIAEACARARPPLVVIVTDGAGSHPGSRSHPPARLAAVREDEARAAVAILGLPPERLHFLRLPDTQAPLQGAAFDAAAAAVTRLVRECGVTTLLATWPHDPHCDHEATHALAVAVATATGARLLSYPVWGWLLPPETALPGPPPIGARLDIAAHLPAKRRAIAAHATQYADVIRDSPGGFRLPPPLLAAFDRPYEVFLDMP